jgi:hypothetical protein
MTPDISPQKKANKEKQSESARHFNVFLIYCHHQVHPPNFHLSSLPTTCPIFTNPWNWRWFLEHLFCKIYGYIDTDIDDTDIDIDTDTDIDIDTDINIDR